MGPSATNWVNVKPMRSRALSRRMPRSGTIQNGLIKFGKAPAALKDTTAQPKLTCRSFAACMMNGASMIHRPPPDGRNIPVRVEYRPTNTAKLSAEAA